MRHLEGPKKDGSLRNGISNALDNKEKVSLVLFFVVVVYRKRNIPSWTTLPTLKLWI